jgi:hypothetical protein
MSENRSGTSEKHIAAVQRQAAAVELRKAGKSYQAIASHLGYKGPSGAYKAVSTALKKMIMEPVEELRTLEEQRLDTMLAAIWPAVLRGDLGAVDRGLRIMERRAKLEGLDAPVKVDMAAHLRKIAEAEGWEEEEIMMAIAEAERLTKKYPTP